MEFHGNKIIYHALFDSFMYDDNHIGCMTHIIASGILELFPKMTNLQEYFAKKYDDRFMKMFLNLIKGMDKNMEYVSLGKNIPFTTIGINNYQHDYTLAYQCENDVVTVYVINTGHGCAYQGVYHSNTVALTNGVLIRSMDLKMAGTMERVNHFVEKFNLHRASLMNVDLFYKLVLAIFFENEPSLYIEDKLGEPTEDTYNVSRKIKENFMRSTSHIVLEEQLSGSCSFRSFFYILPLIIWMEYHNPDIFRTVLCETQYFICCYVIENYASHMMGSDAGKMTTIEKVTSLPIEINRVTKKEPYRFLDNRFVEALHGAYDNLVEKVHEIKEMELVMEKHEYLTDRLNYLREKVREPTNVTDALLDFKMKIHNYAPSKNILRTAPGINMSQVSNENNYNNIIKMLPMDSCNWDLLLSWIKELAALYIQKLEVNDLIMYSLLSLFEQKLAGIYIESPDTPSLSALYEIYYSYCTVLWTLTSRTGISWHQSFFCVRYVFSLLILDKFYPDAKKNPADTDPSEKVTYNVFSYAFYIDIGVIPGYQKILERMDSYDIHEVLMAIGKEDTREDTRINQFKDPMVTQGLKNVVYHLDGHVNTDTYYKYILLFYPLFPVIYKFDRMNHPVNEVQQHEIKPEKPLFNVDKSSLIMHIANKTYDNRYCRLDNSPKTQVMAGIGGVHDYGDKYIMENMAFLDDVTATDNFLEVASKYSSDNILFLYSSMGDNSDQPYYGLKKVSFLGYKNDFHRFYFAKWKDYIVAKLPILSKRLCEYYNQLHIDTINSILFTIWFFVDLFRSFARKSLVDEASAEEDFRSFARKSRIEESLPDNDPSLSMDSYAESFKSILTQIASEEISSFRDRDSMNFHYRSHIIYCLMFQDEKAKELMKGLLANYHLLFEKEENKFTNHNGLYFTLLINRLSPMKLLSIKNVPKTLLFVKDSNNRDVENIIRSNLGLNDRNYVILQIDRDRYVYQGESIRVIKYERASDNDTVRIERYVEREDGKDEFSRIVSKHAYECLKLDKIKLLLDDEADVFFTNEKDYTPLEIIFNFRFTQETPVVWIGIPTNKKCRYNVLYQEGVFYKEDLSAYQATLPHSDALEKLLEWMDEYPLVWYHPREKVLELDFIDHGASIMISQDDITFNGKRVSQDILPWTSQMPYALHLTSSTDHYIAIIDHDDIKQDKPHASGLTKLTSYDAFLIPNDIQCNFTEAKYKGVYMLQLSYNQEFFDFF